MVFIVAVIAAVALLTVIGATVAVYVFMCRNKKANSTKEDLESSSQELAVVTDDDDESVHNYEAMVSVDDDQKKRKNSTKNITMKLNSIALKDIAVESLLGQGNGVQS